MNRLRGVATTEDNIFSPKWTFNFLNHGTGSGTNYSLVYGILKQHGCPLNKSFPYDAKDYLSWSTDEKVWREAMRYRLKDHQLFDRIGTEGLEITSPDDTDLLPIKASLANGDVLTCSTFMTSVQKGKKTFKTNPNAPENDERHGYKYKYVLEDTSPNAQIYFSGDNGKIDNNNGNYYTANVGLNYYFTKGQRNELQIGDLKMTNGSDQTVDIKYSGGEVKYYALSTKTGNGYNVETW